MRVLDISKLQTFTAVNLLSDPGAIPGKVQIPNAAQIVLTWTLADGKSGHNVLYGRYIPPFAGTAAQATAILAALGSGAQWTAYAAFLATTTSLFNVTIRDVNTIDQPIISATTGAAPGASASPEMPDEVAAVVTLRTGKVGPGNRGRIYLPGFATNALATGNVIAPATVTALGNWAQTIKTAFAAQGYTLALGQRERAAYTSPITGANFPHRPAAAPDITALVVRDNHWDSQRRRGLR